MSTCKEKTIEMKTPGSKIFESGSAVSAQAYEQFEYGSKSSENVEASLVMRKSKLDCEK